VDPREHPQLDRFLAAINGPGFAPGEELPFHQPGCYGCGPDNPDGFGLVAFAAEPGAVEADYVFGPRYEGGPGVVHGGATAAVLDDLYGRLLVRILTLAVTVDLQVGYHRAVHLEEPCRLRAELVEHVGRDLTMRASLTQQGEEKVTSHGRFRTIGLDRLANRYERSGPDPIAP
jgi:acyl-coenzyme A thioesterase PaaI-like protein